MKKTDLYTYVIDFDHSHNRAVIESAKPGVVFNVRVKPAEGPAEDAILAPAKLSEDGKRFVVTLPDDHDPIEWVWSYLQVHLRSFR